MEAFFEMIEKFLEVFSNRQTVDLWDYFPEDAYIIILIAALFMIIGVLQCFLGFKSFKVWCSFIGLVIGAVLGAIFVLALPLTESNYAEIIAIFFVVCLGIVGAFVAYRAYLIGVFLYAFLALFMLCYIPLSSLVEPVMIAIIVGVCAGVAAGVVAVIVQRISIIVATCLSGGLCVAAGLMMIFEGTSTFLAVVLPAILGLACAGGGFFVQLATTKTKPKVVVAPAPVVNVNVQGTATVSEGSTTPDAATAAVTADAPASAPESAAPATESAPASAPEPVAPAPETPPEPPADNK